MQDFFHKKDWPPECLNSSGELWYSIFKATMIAKLQPNRVRRSYLGGARIDAFCRVESQKSQVEGRRSIVDSSTVLPSLHFSLSTLNSPAGAQPRPEDWLASTTQAFNGTLEIEGEGLGRLEDGRLVRDAVGALPILVKLLDSDERLVVQAHPTVPCARPLFNSPVGKTECWYSFQAPRPTPASTSASSPASRERSGSRPYARNLAFWKNSTASPSPPATSFSSTAACLTP